MSKIKLDLHDIYNNSTAIETSLTNLIEDAIESKIKLVEIIPGKGSGQLKKRVLRFLESKEIKQHIKRIEKDSKNFGRLFVHLNL
jgi:dsDNA-specific endonuclease/ATPase MutS2